jgi:predicted lipoprotein
MSATVASRPAAPKKMKGRLVIGACVVVVLAAMAWDTKVVEIGTEAELAGGFSAETYGGEHFPAIRDSVEARAVEAGELASAVLEDSSAAGQKYGVGESFGPVVPVTFSGTFGEARSGIYTVEADGVPDEITIRVQTGPAINGTDLRDATGEISFGEFTNQIEYQNAGASINEAMKAAVLADIDTASLSGKTVSVTGVFKLINPKNWLVTPVSMEVQ